MSAIEKAAAVLRQEAEGLKACHTLGDDWCGDPAEADYREMIAAADAAIAERDALHKALAQHHAKEMGQGRDPSHSLTKLAVSAYQQSRLCADTLAALAALEAKP